VEEFRTNVVAVARCAVSVVDYIVCHAPKKEGAHYFGTAVKNQTFVLRQIKRS